MFTENKTTEFKREYVEDIKNTIIAFANCDGGMLYIGVNDDGSVCGVDDVDATMLRVTNAIRDAVRPDITMFIECRNDVMDGKSVVLVTVQRGTARPYYLHGKGIRPEGVYVRQGASTVPATDAAILSMIKETSGDNYEAARSINQQLTFEKAADFFKKRNVEFGKAQMRTLHLIGEDDTYSNLAFLLSDQCAHSIKLAVFEGSKKSVFKDRRELSGSLLEQLEEAFDYIDRYNRTRAEFSGLDRVDMRDYPPEAVREALLNAIVHRDYSFSGSTLISIFEDRIEFVTIGGLVRGITLDDVKLGISVLRNQYLANIFYRLRLIEAYGTGILKINESYDDCDMKPLIETTSNAFKITLPNSNFRAEGQSSQNTGKSGGSTSMSKKESRVKAILELCRKQGSFVRTDVESALGISQATAILLLRELVDDGVLKKEGKGKNLRYLKNK
ncbi:MAG: putative DNA binding domain-containing protein [Oscillospiraceae bacterium]|nr:putative DNA binding domain-containing protein [Oscillospiraceae bacterium]